MAKLSNDKITSAKLQEYITKHSDFSFEMEVLNSIPETWIIEHGGTYEDPVTGKYREFDIRASYQLSGPFNPTIWLAIEAKNITESFPMLVSCIPRTTPEAYHQIIISNFKLRHGFVTEEVYGNISNVNVHHNKLYENGKLVGKSLTQVGVKEYDKSELVYNDSEVYTKWAQAVNSSYDLAEKAYFRSSESNGGVYISVILPMLVVPDNTLWTSHFDASGRQVNKPEPCDHCHYFIGRKFQLGDGAWSEEFSISHIHFITFSEFNKFLADIDGIADLLIPKEAIHFR